MIGQLLGNSRSKKIIKNAVLLAFGVFIFIPLQVRAEGKQPSRVVMLDDVVVNRNNDGVTLDLSLEKGMSARGLKPIYERNFVQFVMTGIGVKTAKLIPVNDSNVEKIFVYQYAPGIARVRFILKNDSQWAKGRINIWNARNDRIRFSVKDPTHLAKDNSISKDDASLLKNVLQSTAPVAQEIKNAESKAATVTAPQAEVAAVSRDSAVVTVKAAAPTKNAVQQAEADNASIGIKAEPSRYFLRMAISLFVVLGFFIGLVFLLKKYSTKLNLSKLPFGKKERLIQVIATHRLGKSQSISLVKVTGEYMVIGTAGDNVSLITKLGADVDVEKYLEDRYWGGSFEKHLKILSKPEDPDMDSAPVQPLKEKSGLQFRYDGARDVAETKSDFRSTIKDKITKLKPLS